MASTGAAADPAQIFVLGQEALKQNRLAEAERDFQQVLAANPEVGGAYANLGCGLHAAQAMVEGFGSAEPSRALDASSSGNPAEYWPGLFPAK